MIRAFASLVLVLALAAPAQADLGLGRRLAQPQLEAPPEEPPPEAPTAPAPDVERPWPGPQVHLAYSFYRIADGYGGGDVHAGSVEVFLQLPLPELRLGALGEIGSRDYALGGDDLVVRGGVEIGVQLVGWIDPVVPYASLLVSFGGVVGERFDTTVAHAFGGAGLALGAALRIHRNLHLDLHGSYQRLEMDGAAFDVFMLRVALGL